MKMKAIIAAFAIVALQVVGAWRLTEATPLPIAGGYRTPPTQPRCLTSPLPPVHPTCGSQLLGPAPLLSL